MDRLSKRFFAIQQKRIEQQRKRLKSAFVSFHFLCMGTTGAIILTAKEDLSECEENSRNAECYWILTYINQSIKQFYSAPKS